MARDDMMSDSDEDAPPPNPPTKPLHRSRDDLSANVQLSERTRGTASRKPSEKQAHKEKENLEAAEAKILRLQKELLKVKRKAKNPATVADDDDLESEERDNEDDSGTIQFHSSIKPLGVLPPAPPQSMAIHRKGSRKTVPKTSSRAFLTAPDSSSLGTSPPPTPSTAMDPGDMVIDEGGHAGTGDEDDQRHDDWTHRSRASTPQRSKRPQPSSSPAPAPVAKRLRKDPQFAQGHIAAAGTKPKAADYESVVQALLIRAMAEYSMLILTIYAFPDAGLQTQWAKRSFKNACRSADQWYKLTERMAKLITKRGSHVRGQIVSAIRTLFAPHYNFNHTGTAAAIQSNITLSAKLLDAATFGYKDIDERKGYAGNKILDNSRHVVIFADKRSLGSIFASHFDPYPLPTVALEFLALEHCAQEWSTGKFVAAQFTEKAMSKSYGDHLKDINKWAEFNTEVVRNLRHKWYVRASRSLGLATVSKGDSNINVDVEAALREELEGRTGETDSEAEDPEVPERDEAAAP
ncbi:hypothetical protein B0H11DRAFT_1993060 [Mycena galericulata]|nr:hypothetical protein B0H11DRAFT_1993060 [Mycena galericulata]